MILDVKAWCMIFRAKHVLLIGILLLEDKDAKKINKDFVKMCAKTCYIFLPQNKVV